MRKFLLENRADTTNTLQIFVPFGLFQDLLIKGFPDTMVQAINKGLISNGFHIMGDSDDVRITLDTSKLKDVNGFKTLESIIKIEISAKVVSTDEDIDKLQDFAFKLNRLLPDISFYVSQKWDDDITSNVDNTYGSVFLPKDKWHMTEESLSLLRKAESVRLEPYWDVKHWAIGYGHMLPSRYALGEKITKEKADELFKDDIKRFENAVKDSINVPLTMSMYGALVSYAYNCGVNGFKNSDVARAINNRDYKKAVEILKTSKVHDPGSKYHKGLLARRAREADFFDNEGLS